jgi:hypothetical protein
MVPRTGQRLQARTQRGRRPSLQAQGTLQRVDGIFQGAVIGLDQKLERPRASADQLDRLRIGPGRRHGNADRQYEPRQHQTCKPPEGAVGLRKAEPHDARL